MAAHRVRDAIRSRETARKGAGDGIRTRDIQLGKLTLYQLSYTRALRLRLAGGGAVRHRRRRPLRSTPTAERSTAFTMPTMTAAHSHAQPDAWNPLVRCTIRYSITTPSSR